MSMFTADIEKFKKHMMSEYGDQSWRPILGLTEQKLDMAIVKAYHIRQNDRMAFEGDSIDEELVRIILLDTVGFGCVWPKKKKPK
jgi:hypothetical protein